jgi:starch-binding outer membrane protein, SusD/RagB family
MKNRNIYQLILLSLIFLLSCEDKLNVEPTQSISDVAALSSAASINKLLIGTYRIAGDAYSHGGYVQIFSDLLGADDEVTWNGTFYEPREALTKNMLANNYIIGEMWKNMYKAINQSNLVLGHLDVITDAAERSRVEGEARFLRAINYFELVRLFGNDIKGVPLRLEPIEDYGGDLSIARNTTAEVYQAILGDLSNAVSLLPDDNDVYADKYAAEAFLARVQLYLGHYAEARDAADDILTNSGKALSADFAAAFNHDDDNEEDIFAMQVTSQGGDNQLIQMYASEDNGGRGGDISINQSYLDIFDDPNDQRSQFFYENPKGDRLSGKYTNQFGNVPVIRLAEIILIRAECNVRLSTTIGAPPLDDVNAIRLRSGASLLGAITVEDILKERKRELAFEGFWIYDIKRTQGSVQGIAYDDPRLVMPIPQAEIDANNKMEQNEGY